MSESSLETLFHPFEAGLIDMPGEGTRVLVQNAPAELRLPEGWDGTAQCIQDFRPVFLALRKAGFDVGPVAEDTGYDLALVICGRHRGRNELHLADALERLSPNGLVVVAGHKKEGAASMKKRVAKLAEIEGHTSKSHGVAFWLRRPADAVPLVAALRNSNGETIVEGGFRTSPGLFSHDRVDPGSRLLADSLPDDMAGLAADFGGGWGYLSVRLAQKAPGLRAVHLYEASFAACEAARRNMAELAPQMASDTFWRDLIGEKVERRYDLVVMNPPFHRGRAAEPAIGERIIECAAAALKPGGRLFLVANRQLPYEKALEQAFTAHGETTRNDTFKVLWARR